MKAFITTVASSCLCAMLLCFWAYATGNLPLSNTTPQRPVPVSAEQATTVEENPLCSPCVENMVEILEMMEKEWGADMTAFLEQPANLPKPAAREWDWLSSEQQEQAQQLIDQYGTEEGLRRLREMDPDAAERFERKRRGTPSRDIPDRGQSESGSKD